MSLAVLRNPLPTKSKHSAAKHQAKLSFVKLLAIVYYLIFIIFIIFIMSQSILKSSLNHIFISLIVIVSLFTTEARSANCSVFMPGISNDFCSSPTGGGSSYASGPDSRTDTRIYTGFVWELGSGQSLMPMFQIGIRTLEVKENDNVQGADLNVRIKYDQSISFDSTRISYVGGERNFMGNVGFGYSNTSSSWLATVAVQSAYTRLSTDYLFADNKFKFFAELNTLDSPKEYTRPLIQGGQPTCENGELIQIDRDSIVDPADVVNGYTCTSS